MRNFLFVLVAMLVDVAQARGQVGDAMRETIFGDRVRRSTNSESSNQSSGEDRFEAQRRLLYSDLGIVPEAEPMKIDFVSEGDTFAQIDVRSAEDIRFHFFGRSPKTFSLHFVELGFFLRGGSRGMEASVRKDPRPLASEIHFNSIYASARSFLASLRGYKNRYGSKLEPSREQTEGLNTLESLVPNGWSAEIFEEPPMIAFALRQKVHVNSYRYRLYTTPDRGNFLTGYAPATWPVKDYPEVFGLGKVHVERLSNFLYPIGDLPFCEDHRDEQRAKGVLWQRDLEAAGDWKHWRRDAATGDYMREYNCLAKNPVSYSQRFSTEAERKKSLEKQMREATWTGRD